MPAAATTTTQQKSKASRTGGTGADSHLAFPMQEIEELKGLHGFSALQGADAAVLSAQTGVTPAPTDPLSYRENMGAEPELAAEEDIGFFGKVDRFFSRKIDFSINGTPVKGTAGHQVRAGSVPLGAGLVLDLAPATLTGKRQRSLHIAYGHNAQLYFAPKGVHSVLRQEITHVVLDSQQKLRADSLKETVLPVDGANIKFGPSITEQQTPNTAVTTFSFVHPLSVGAQPATSVMSSKLVLQDGEGTMEALSFFMFGRSIELKGLTFEQDGLHFTEGHGKNSLGHVDFTESMLTEAKLREQIDANWQEDTPAAPAATPAASPATPAAPEPDSPDVLPLSEENPVKIAPPTTLANGMFELTNVVQANSMLPEFIADVTFKAPLRTLNGTKSIDFGEVSGTKDHVTVTATSETVASAQIGDITVESEAEDLDGYEIIFSNVSVQDNVLVADKIHIGRERDGWRLASEVDEECENQTLKDLLTFTIPPMPERTVFHKMTHLSAPGTGNELVLTDAELDKPLLRIEDAGGMFDASIDFRDGTFSLVAKDDSDLDSSSFFSGNEITLLEVPIITGLTFGVSLTPSAKMSLALDIHGKLGENLLDPEKDSSFSLGGSAAIGLKMELKMNADLELGLGRLASVYAGLFATVAAETSAKIGLEAAVSKKKKKLNFDSLDLSGEINAALTGSIGVHGGLKFLVWNAELFEYTFKQWDLATMALDATISKDMQKPFAKGWGVEKSSFSIEGFGKAFAAKHNVGNRLLIQPEETKLMDAIRFETDYGSFHKNLTDAAKKFQLLQSVVNSTEGSPLIIDQKKLQEQVDVILGYRETMVQQAEKADTQEQLLHDQIWQQRYSLEKEGKKNANTITKHNTRLIHLEHVENTLHNASSPMSYEMVSKKAEDATKEQILTAERSKLNIFGRAREYEVDQMNHYIALRDNSTRKRKDSDEHTILKPLRLHQSNILKMDGFKDAALGDDAAWHKKAIEQIGNPVAKQLDKQAVNATNRRMRSLNSTAFKKTKHDKAVDLMTTEEEVAARKKYEEKRLNELAPKTLTEALTQTALRREEIMKIKEENKKMLDAVAEVAPYFREEHALPPRPETPPTDPAAPAPATDPAAEVAAMAEKTSQASKLVEKLLPILNSGTGLRSTADQFEFLLKAEASREEQQRYLAKAAL